MIKLQDGELLDLLPSPQLKKDTDMICLSYALKVVMDELLEYEKYTMTQNFIDLLPEHILDVLAVELRSPYYSQDMEIEVKRGIIRNTLIWHMKAGTPAAVSEMISVLFGSGRVVEWWDFDEGEKTPGTFDIVTSARMTEDIAEYFLHIIQRVKNERSHLRRVLVERKIETEPSIAAGAVFSPETTITNNTSERASGAASKAQCAAGAISFPIISILNGIDIHDDSLIPIDGKAGSTGMTYPDLVILNTKEETDHHFNLKAREGVGSVTSAHVTITNHPRKDDTESTAALSATAGAVSYPKNIIK